MKKTRRILILLSVCLLLAACGEQKQENYASLLGETDPAIEPTPGQSEPAATYVIRRAVANTWTDSIGSPWVQVIVEVENTGSVPLYLSGASADIETDDGQLFAVLDGLSGRPQILLPGERGSYIEETSLDAVPEGELSVVPYLEIAEATVPATRFAVTDVTVSADQYGRLKAMGRVGNPTESDAESVTVAVLLYDEKGDCIGCVYTTLTNGVPAGERRGFEANNIMLPEDVTPEDVAYFEAFAYPYQYQW